MINENYFAANGCSLLFFDRQARRLSDERYGKYHADETSALPGGLSVILSNSGFFVPFYVESRLHPLFLNCQVIFELPSCFELSSYFELSR